MKASLSYYGSDTTILWKSDYQSVEVESRIGISVALPMACGGFFTMSATGCKAGRDIGRGIKRKPIGLSIPVECDGPRPMGYFITEKFLYISLY